jgi:hypothetical protein
VTGFFASVCDEGSGSRRRFCLRSHRRDLAASVAYHAASEAEGARKTTLAYKAALAALDAAREQDSDALHALLCRALGCPQAHRVRHATGQSPEKVEIIVGLNTGCARRLDSESRRSVSHKRAARRLP